MHEEDNAEEEHGQATANLGDDGEVVQVRTRNGFIKRSLQRWNTFKHFVTGTGNQDGLWWTSLWMGEIKNEVATIVQSAKCLYPTGSVYHENTTKEV